MQIKACSLTRHFLPNSSVLNRLFPLQLLTIILELLVLLKLIFHICVLPLAGKHLVLLVHLFGDHSQTSSDAVQAFGCSQNSVKSDF